MKGPFPAVLVELGCLLLLGLAFGVTSLLSWIAAWEFDQIFNFAEALLWFGIALAFLVGTRKRHAHRDLSLVLALAFVAFGISDLIEIKTRAWFRPFGLLVLKAACVATFLVCLQVFYRRSRTNDKCPPPDQSDHRSQ